MACRKSKTDFQKPEFIPTLHLQILAGGLYPEAQSGCKNGAYQRMPLPRSRFALSRGYEARSYMTKCLRCQCEARSLIAFSPAVCVCLKNTLSHFFEADLYHPS